jgi:hypothetical protein
MAEAAGGADGDKRDPYVAMPPTPSRCCFTDDLYFLLLIEYVYNRATGLSLLIKELGLW